LEAVSQNTFGILPRSIIPAPAVETAAKPLRDLRVGEVSKLDMKVEGGKVVAYRAKVSLSFKYETLSIRCEFGNCRTLQ
jgi:flavin-binding protein dodecin